MVDHIVKVKNMILISSKSQQREYKIINNNKTRIRYVSLILKKE
jgi:hypothetical protein